MFRFSKDNAVFNKGSISTVYQAIRNDFISKLSGETEHFILNANETEYIAYVESAYSVAIPVPDFEAVTVDTYEDDVPSEYFLSSFHVEPGKAYRMEIFQFFIPCMGDVSCLQYTPSNLIFSGATTDFYLKGNELVIDLINFTGKHEDIRREYDQQLYTFKGMYDCLVKNMEMFNEGIANEARNEFRNRRSKILAKNQILTSLGVPLRRKEGVTNTFAVPKPQLRQKIVVKPIVNATGFKPEPTLDDSSYLDILKIINDVGKNFERMPSVYKGKEEEHLRDHIVLTLDPNFELGSASGETFNRTGKTDIQLRYDSTVVFIAECKFWHGEKSYLATIDQLLNYLTWRDTKAAVIIFVRQKDFTGILSKIGDYSISHRNYLSTRSKLDENWFNFRFHLNDDRNRELSLAVQLFHLPD